MKSASNDDDGGKSDTNCLQLQLESTLKISLHFVENEEMVSK